MYQKFLLNFLRWNQQMKSGGLYLIIPSVAVQVVDKNVDSQSVIKHFKNHQNM